MNRPERQLEHLKEKIGDKASRSLKKPGKKAKRWKAAASKYETLVASAQG